MDKKLFTHYHHTIREMNQEKKKITALVEKYRTLCQSMAEVENLFLSHVVVSGTHLKMSIAKREFLEREYERILQNSKWGVYSSLEHIEEDVQRTLTRADTMFVSDEEGQEGEKKWLQFTTPDEHERESTDLFDETRKKKILKEFRKVVIPKVHADTSETPFDIFSFVLEVYKKRNYLLMGALIIQYQEELSWPDDSQAITELIEVIKRNSVEYPLISMGLAEKIDRLKQNMSTKELGSSEAVKDQLRKQNEEISKAINDEAEKILVLMKKLDDLCEGNFPVDEGKKS